MYVFLIGQRWISVNEMDLGLGLVVKTQGRFVELEFPASSQTRTYNMSNAPLKRFMLEVGDSARNTKGEGFVVAKITEHAGLLRYEDAQHNILPEEELHHRINARRNDLFAKITSGQVDSLKRFLLRQQVTELNFQWLGSPARGMVGPRVDLIPHQYYISQRGSASSSLPRLMLSDEVGLGKTIEAGMIWHSLRMRHRITRTLIIVPESLKHQWMLEMLRRFNHFFTLVDVGYIQSLEPARDEPMPNPFTLRNEMLCTFDYLIEEPSLYEDLLKVEWDLIIIDEAHHLRCEGDDVSLEYQIVRNIAAKTKGLLFLTATPLQLDEESHFNRLRLLDPHRYQNYQQYQDEQNSYQELVKDLNRFIEAETEQQSDITWDHLEEAIPEDSPIRPWIENVSTQSLEAGEWVRRIVDALGTGSTIFRNTRKSITGFPQRILHAYPLEPNPSYRQIIQVASEKYPDEVLSLSLNGMLSIPLAETWEFDERVEWLKGFLETHRHEKILLICSDIEVVLALDKILAKTIDTKDYVLFHEQMKLLTRDRAAAYFALREGARLLVSSEIGSEGRNFQFARHLVLFDLPMQATQLEQRIGRLDRIGQGDEVHIHVPYAKGSGLETFFIWFHEGLNAFKQPFMGSEYMFKKYQDSLFETIIEPGLLPMFKDQVIPLVQEDIKNLRDAIEEGRDRLLEYNSFNEAAAKQMVDLVDEFDSDRNFSKVMVSALEEFGVDVEEGKIPRSLILRSTPQMKVELPGFFARSQVVSNLDDSEDFEDEYGNNSGESGVIVSLDRHEALSHDELEFLSWEHPIAQGVFDLVLGADFGNVAVASWNGAPEKRVLMQYNFVHEIPTDPEWGLSDLTPPRLIKVLVDADGKDFSSWLEALSAAELKGAAIKPGPHLDDRVKRFAGKGLSAAKKIAEQQSAVLMQQSLDAVGDRLDKEYNRAQYLVSLQGKTRGNTDLKNLRFRNIERKKSVQNPQLRLDGVCLLVCL